MRLLSFVTYLIYLSNFTQLVLTISSGAESRKADNEGDTDAFLIEKWIAAKNTSNLGTKSGLDNSKNEQSNSHKNCQCVKYYMCNSVTENGTLNNSSQPQDILGTVDIRRPNSTGTSFEINNGCQHYFDVCCTDVKSDSATEKPISSEDPKPDTSIVKKDWVHTDCGQRNENGIGFNISGGTGMESQFGEFPWTAAVAEEEVVEVDGPNGKENSTRNVLLCGGSLIHPQVVITVAHCVYESAYSSKSKLLKVRLGEWDTQTTDEPYPYQDRKVKEIIIHRQFYIKGLFNDVALLILEKEVKLAPNVDTICLAPKALELKDIVGETCFSSGWGKNDFGAEGRYQEIMKKVETTVVSREDCQAALRKTRLTNRFILHQSFLCANGQPGHDTCSGDGGSPFICKAVNSQKYFLTGLVAWGIGCNSETPGVYVNMLDLAPWVFQTLRKRQFETKFCTF